MTICLCMIVKNEAAVITRCLKSVLPLIDTWVIIDTGSTDGTQDIIKKFMADVPGELYEHTWIDFAANRTEALTLARQSGADYSFVIDADDVLTFNQLHCVNLTHGVYNVDITFGGVRYQRPQLFSNRLPWRYKGALHEYAECPFEHTRGHLSDLTIVCGNDGARRQNPDKYINDATLLLKELQTENDPFLRSRYTFYLAQSFRDAGQGAQADRYYRERTTQGFWDEEVYISHLNIARWAVASGADPDIVNEAFYCAKKVCPHRAEAFYELALYNRSLGYFEIAYDYAERGSKLPMPQGLFIETSVYQYAIADELSISAYYIGRYAEALSVCLALLKQGVAPDEHRDRIVANATFAAEKLIQKRDMTWPKKT